MDWVPRNVAPFIWINQESEIDTNNQPSGGVKASARTLSDVPDLKQQKLKSSESSQEPARKSDSLPLTLSSSSSTVLRNRSLEELTRPLLESDQPQGTSDLKELSTPSLQNDHNTHEASEEKREDVSVCESPSISMVMDKPNSSIEQDDLKP